MSNDIVFWPVAPVLGMLAASAVIFVFGYLPRRKTGTLVTKVVLLMISLVLVVAAAYFWGYYLFYDRA